MAGSGKGAMAFRDTDIFRLITARTINIKDALRIGITHTMVLSIADIIGVTCHSSSH